MKKISVLFLILILSYCVFCGCDKESTPPSDNAGAESTTDTTEAPKEKKPVIDLNAIVGKTEHELVVADQESGNNLISRTPTNLGDLCADAYRSSTGADAAIVRAAELSVGIPKGDITVGTVFNVLPQESRLVTLRATGAEVLDCLETAYRLLPEESPDYLHLSGITLIVDPNKTSHVKTDENGNIIEISGDRRVRNVYVGEAPLDTEKIYTITFSDSLPEYMADIFKGDRIEKTDIVSNRTALMSYISVSLAGVIGDEYGDPFGTHRIGVVPLGMTEIADAASSLPQIYLTATDKINRSDYVDCSVTIHDPTGVYTDIYDTDSTIKIRGNSTASGKKSPYNIKFSESVELFGLGKGKKWSLLANLYDKTQFRNYLTYTFAQELGITSTSSSCFVEVYLNGDYRGMYQLCEPVDVGGTKVDIDTDNNEFLLELEPFRGYSNKYYVVTPSYRIILGYNEPEEPTDEQRKWLLSFMTEVEKAIQSNDYEKVKEYVDVESFARCYIIQELFKNTDYLKSSTRFYVKGNKLYEGPVWDFDLSSGNCSSSYFTEYNNVGGSGLSYEGLLCVGIFNKHLFKYDEFRSLVSELYAELQPNIINLYRNNELGRNRIDTLVEAHREAIDRNNTLWSTKYRYNIYEHQPVDGTYDGEITFLKDWLEKRNEWLYEYYCSDAQ